jgi:hypothetical protein
MRLRPAERKVIETGQGPMGHVMIYRGRVRDGQVVLEPPDRLPEGAEVVVEVLSPDTEVSKGPLMRYAGRVVDLPEDASMSVDRVLYGRDAP